MARFGLQGLRTARQLAGRFKTTRAQALFAGLAAHGIMPFDKMATAAIGLVLGIEAHTVGWPYPKGGSHAITQAMASYLKELGGTVKTNAEIRSLDEFDSGAVILFNTTPRQILDIAGKRLSPGYAKKLRNYEYGSGVFKIDLALSE